MNVNNVKRHKRRRRVSIKMNRPPLYRPRTGGFVDYEIVEESIEIIVETEYILVNTIDDDQKSTVLYDSK